jgi:hypothetical protein
MNEQLDRIQDWFNQRRGKYDFEQRCLFPEQITYKMYREGNKQFAFVPMKSGRTGLYEVTTDRCDYSADDTGQRHWKYKLVKFVGLDRII